jgi:hypothetical protein
MSHNTSYLGYVTQGGHGKEAVKITSGNHLLSLGVEKAAITPPRYFSKTLAIPLFDFPLYLT